MKKKRSEKTKRTKSINLSRLAKKVLVLLLCSILLTNVTIPKAEQKADAAAVLPAVAPVLGEVLFGLLASAGIIYTGYEIHEAALEEQDIAFSDEYDLSKWGYSTDAEEFAQSHLLWDCVLDASSKGSKIAQEVERLEGEVVDNPDWESSLAGSPNQPPSDPNKFSFKKLLVGTALSMQINAALLSPVNDVSMALQQVVQPQIEYSLYSEHLNDNILEGLSILENHSVETDFSITGFLSSSNRYNLKTIPVDSLIVDYVYSFYGSLQYCRLIFSNHNFNTNVVIDTSLHNRSVPFEYNQDHNFYYYSICNDLTDRSNYINPPDLFLGTLPKDSVYYVSDAAPYIYENYGIGTLLGQQRTPYVPDMISNNGNITNVGDINPVYNQNQYFSYPKKNEIENFYDTINNYYDTTNNDFHTDQEYISNYFNDFIQQHVHDDPAVTPAPTAAPPTSAPEPSTAPQPSVSPDDDNDKYTTPDLKNFFPFCIPWDIYDMFSKFTENRKAPVIEFHLKSEMFGFDHPIKIDLSAFDDVAAVCRLLELILFIIGLAVATRKLIGAGG